MSQKEKLIRALTRRPPPADFTWLDLVKLLKAFGFEKLPSGKIGGSRRKFMREDGRLISL